jgi:carboxyl-terminal processing protease
MKRFAQVLMALALLSVTVSTTTAQVAPPNPTMPPNPGQQNAPGKKGLAEPKEAQNKGKDGKKAEDDLIIILGPQIGPKVKAEPSPEQLQAYYKQIWRKLGKEYNDPAKLKKWSEWESKFDGKIKTVKDLEKALKEMVSSLGDRWTTYTSTDDIDTYKQNAKDGIIGIGMMVRKHTANTWNIDGMQFGSPAQQSMLREGDEVKAIIRDGKRNELSQLTATEVTKLLSGKVGERLTVVAVWDGKDHEIELTFAEVQEAGVQAGILPGKIGYIRLPTFVSEETVGEFIQILGQMYTRSKGDLNGLVIDLRYNGGGLVTMALTVSSLFIENGTIVKTTTRDDRNITETAYKVGPIPQYLVDKMPKQMTEFQRFLQTVPLVILTNGSTASASEITTGALRDNKRAVVIGTHTFGKAVGYNRTGLATGGVLQITSLSYLTPSGTDIGGKGIMPDQLVEQPREGTEDDVQLMAAHKYLMELAKQRAQEMRDARDIAGQPQQDATPVSDEGMTFYPLYAIGGLLFLLCLALVVRFWLARRKRSRR